MTREADICCICGEEYRNYGNNAHPVADGRCCDACNEQLVIPARIFAMLKEREEPE